MSRRLTLGSFQRRNARIFTQANDRHYCPEWMVLKMYRFYSKLLGCSLGGSVRADYYLTMVLSWSCGLANTLHINLERLGNSPYLPTENPTTSSSLNEALLSMGGSIAELGEIVTFLTGTNNTVFLNGIKTYLFVSIMHTCAVAQFLDIDLGDEFRKCFGKGCPKCHFPICDCGFLPAKVM